MNSPTKTNGAKSLIILLLVFVMPVAVAKLVLAFDLYQGGATNKGELLSNDISYQSLAITNPSPAHWQLMYLVPSDCAQQCQNRLYILKQSHTAMGREQERIQPVVLVNQHSDTRHLGQYDFNVVDIGAQNPSVLEQQAVVVVDPLGSFVMRYPSVSDKEQQIMQGKSMVADLRKLLKLSRVG
ncbi:hypothetical protein [Shewanella waksmanii]|uniref:hypothetical protein n=1 Tax=Shewanella waksmanii TaxID=213783 RepID=UPI00048EBDC0|nr:hypothetical protein [Shewanella waksmanii]